MIEGSLATGQETHRFRLMWPPDYPYRPPNVWQLAEDGSIIEHRATGHAFADRSICLYGHRPEEGWRPNFTASDALARLKAFLTDPSVFPRLGGFPLEVTHVRVSIHPKVMGALRANTGWGLMTGFLRLDGRLIVVTNTESTTPSGLTVGTINEAPSPLWHKALGLRDSWQGLWCRIDAAIGESPPNRTELVQWLQGKIQYEPARKILVEQQFVLLVGDQIAWFVWLNPPPKLKAALDSCGAKVVYTTPVEEDIRAKLFTRADARLENITSLRVASVAVVGLGSLGSTIAVALAKAGVGRFSLFDPDSFEPENVVRHVGGVFDIGIPKVEVVARAVKKINPDAEIKCVPSALSLDPAGWYTDSMQQLREVLSDPCGLVVCATATSDSERVINALCVAERTPVVFSSVLGNAEHGRIFRVIPQETPCYQCVLLAQAADPGSFPRFEAKDIGTPTYPQPGIPGLGLDIDEVALLTARLALQTLATRIKGGIGYPAAHADHLIWSAHGDWAVDGPLQTRFERILKQANCPVCGIGSNVQLDTDEASELARLVSEATE